MGEIVEENGLPVFEGQYSLIDEVHGEPIFHRVVFNHLSDHLGIDLVLPQSGDFEKGVGELLLSYQRDDLFEPF